jgi:hypothetical protein
MHNPIINVNTFKYKLTNKFFFLLLRPKLNLTNKNYKYYNGLESGKQVVVIFLCSHGMYTVYDLLFVLLLVEINTEESKRNQW